jgi:hypothetical protein
MVLGVEDEQGLRLSLHQVLKWLAMIVRAISTRPIAPDAGLPIVLQAMSAIIASAITATQTGLPVGDLMTAFHVPAQAAHVTL